MTYRIVVTARARADAIVAFRWIAERSPDAATRWSAGLQKAITKSADHSSGQDGSAEEPRSDPVAEFLSPTEYDWNGDIHAAEVAVRAYLSDSHADH